MPHSSVNDQAPSSSATGVASGAERGGDGSTARTSTRSGVNDVLVDAGQLLDGIDDVGRASRKSEVAAEVPVGNPVHARQHRPAEVERHAVQLAVLERRRHALERCPSLRHGRSLTGARIYLSMARERKRSPFGRVRFRRQAPEQDSSRCCQPD